MSIYFDCNYIDVTIPDRDAWAGEEPPLNGLAILTVGPQMKTKMLAYKLNDN